MTICIEERAGLFGVIRAGKMLLNDAGRMIEQWWFELNRKFSMVETDEFVIMPNHLHGIVVITDTIVGADLRVGPVSEGAHAGAPLRRAHPAPLGAPLPKIIQCFKTMMTNEYIRGVKTASWPSFDQRLWQRNYYEHIIRDDESLNRIRQYILDNPRRWAFDRENPEASASEAGDAW